MKLIYKDDYIEKLFENLRDPSKNKKIMQSIISMDILFIRKVHIFDKYLKFY